ncbi:endonuclease/exonuclease/phosphatase family protein [Acidimangrovimonas sediminis]|uniref:endonuclease/exonuclease/phosphatase family protein n=1 Tax=Acidimangrovimonas sediminis TaxID=2056283 RepID=UPI000C80B0E5|nr:endonuclease/exonuclease/phosphatase family protein [Acidimangrovimonas sediminis]
MHRDAPGERLRIASYNIRKCMGTDRRRSPERVLRVIADTDAEITVLQEADRRLGPRPAALPRRAIVEHTAYQPLPVARNEVSLGWHGNAILVKPWIELEEVHHIDLPSFEPRGAVAADLRRDGRMLRVIGVHLGLLGNDRLRQLGAISDWIARQPNLPTLILGDFNEWSPRASFPPLGPDFRVLAPGPSYHARFRLAPLDRIAHDRGWQAGPTGLTDHGEATRASDHLPIWAEMALADRPVVHPVA